MGFTPCKAAQPLQGMQLQERKKNLRVKRCVLILDLKPFWFVRRNQYTGWHYVKCEQFN